MNTNKLIAGLLILLCGLTAVSCKDKKKEDADNKEIPVVVYSDEDKEAMGEFLSNFTEIGFRNFDAKTLTEPDNPDLIRFAIFHNYTRHFYDRVKECKDKNCNWGELTIDGKYAKETIKRYFGVDYDLFSVTESDPPYYYDGELYHFHGHYEISNYHARVDEASQNKEGEVVMTGELYNADNENDRIYSFEAVAEPYNYEGEDTWKIVSIETKY